MKNKTIHWLFTVLVLPAGFLCLMGSQCTQIKPTLGNASTSWKLEKYGDANNPQPVLLTAKPEILLKLDENGHFPENSLLKQKDITSKTHQVKKYNYSFDARTGGQSLLQLWGDQGLIAEVNFVEDGATVPPPTFTADLNKATIYFKRSTHAALIDMLRNENPIFVTINNQPPGFVIVKTDQEPVGEGGK